MQSNTEPSPAVLDDDADPDKLPLNGGSAYNLYATVNSTKDGILFSATPGGQQYSGIKWNRVHSSQSLALTFFLAPEIHYFVSTSEPVLTFDPAEDGHQRAAVVPDSDLRIECHFDAVADDPVKTGELIRIIDPVIVISVKP